MSAPRCVLVLGSGALQIGQAGEFDYSGSQACKALREEGVRTILLNPNIATVQTDEGLADEVYLLPITPEVAERVLERERCDGLLLGFGGQTALNCGLALGEAGVLERLGVRVLGTPLVAVRDTEDRERFVARMQEIGAPCARGRTARTVEEAILAGRHIGYPVMLRAGFALGGRGSALVHDEPALRAAAALALAAAPQILIEESLAGWKELELEIVRDAADHCIAVCAMENVDPMGVHTGDSIVVAPTQTLDDREVQELRTVALTAVRHLGIIGECNIQFALHPGRRELRVIEVNARLSRSSALASKATGYPLAYVAAKLALGRLLPELANAVTRRTTAFFEPALDYVVIKVPRWDLLRFAGADLRIGSEMKSVGEVMAIGRSFGEALQKALRMLELGADGLDPERCERTDPEAELTQPTPNRIFALARLLDEGREVAELAQQSGIDPFFLHELLRLITLRRELGARHGDGLAGLDEPRLRELKEHGFSDAGIAKQLGLREDEVRTHRHALGVRPVLAQIDTLAAEYPALTNFLYLTYGRSRGDFALSEPRTLLLLGAGCYRIGSSVEFDWCAVRAARAARGLGYKVALLNCNPETVSTDYDSCDALIFDEIALESVLELRELLSPAGVAVSFGGQAPNRIAVKFAQSGVPILGTAASAIDAAEDRVRFSELLDRLGLPQPRWSRAAAAGELDRAVASVGGYPVLVRPSYVLSGEAMRVAWSRSELDTYLLRAAAIAPSHPVVLTEFLAGAAEIELDAIAERGALVRIAVSEHIEDAGVHSGDATLVFPTVELPREVEREVAAIGAALARELRITGPFNVQLLYKDGALRIIELNLRASRSLPFVAKVLGEDLVGAAVRAMLGAERATPAEEGAGPARCSHVGVKSGQFSFARLRGADPRLGVEMAATGEAAGLGQGRDEALLKAALATGFRLPSAGILLDAAPDEEASRLGSQLAALGLPLYATAAGVSSLPAHRVLDARACTERLCRGDIDWVVSVSGRAAPEREEPGRSLRRLAVDLGVPLTLDAKLAARLAAALVARRDGAIELRTLPRSAYRSG